MHMDYKASLDAMHLMADWRLAPRQERKQRQPSVETDLFGDRLVLIVVSRHERGLCKYKAHKRRWQAVCYTITTLFNARLLPELDLSQRTALCCWTAVMTRKGAFTVNPLMETIRVRFTTFVIEHPFTEVNYHADLQYDHETTLGELALKIDANTFCSRRESLALEAVPRDKLMEHHDSARMDCESFPRVPVHQWVKSKPEPHVIYTGLHGHGPRIFGQPSPARYTPPTSPRKDAVSPRFTRERDRRGSIAAPAPGGDLEPVAFTTSAELYGVLDLLLDE